MTSRVSSLDFTYTRILSGRNAKHATQQQIGVARLFAAFGLAAVPSATSGQHKNSVVLE